MNRADLMQGRCTHREYYGQFSFMFKSAVLSTYSAEVLRLKLAEDKHLNNIALSFWDTLSHVMLRQCAWKNKDINGTYSWALSDGVCAAKEAARQLAEEL